MSGFLDIKRVILPLECLKEAYSHMRNAGIRRVEGVALFAGIESDSEFTVCKTIVPKQLAMRLESGLLYAVDSEELHSINVWLYENKMSLIAQIHSHPTEAYHSDTDDAYPIVATIGGISIVVPDFASGPVDLNTCAVYRLSSDNDWLELDDAEKENLITIQK